LAHGSSACRGASARLGGDRRRARSVVRRTAQARWRTVLPISGLPSRIAGSDAAHGDGAGHGCRRMREVRQHGFDREQPQSSSNMAARASDARSYGNVIPPFQRIAARSRRSGRCQAIKTTRSSASCNESLRSSRVRRFDCFRARAVESARRQPPWPVCACRRTSSIRLAVRQRYPRERGVVRGASADVALLAPVGTHHLDL
jgi:hypothetical protein